MNVEDWKTYFRDNNLYTLTEDDAEFAVQQTTYYGEERTKVAAKIWHQDKVAESSCENEYLKRLAKWEGMSLH